MTDVTITVRGESHARVRPERAVAHVAATADGPERTAVIERVSALAEPLRGELAARAATGAVAEWSSQRLSVWADRPWNNEGRQLDLVHHAAVEFTATFIDPTDLSDWLNDIALTDGLQVGAIEWQLTPATRARLEREVATDAVAVAVDRATAYAAAIGRHEVTPVEIADLGLLGSTTAPAAPRMMTKAAAFDSAGAAVELRPEEIVVSAGVEARFTAR